MNGRDGNTLHVLVIAGSSERSSSLEALVHQCGRIRTSTSSAASWERNLHAAPDIILVDVANPALANAVIRMADSVPEGAGFIALANHPDPQWVAAALRAGVNAILSREITAEEMKLGILAAEAGFVLLHPSSAHDLSRTIPAITHSSHALTQVEALTTREQEILRLVSQGLGNKEIASRLNISDHTVKFHISSILGKLGASSRTEAVSQGIRRGLIAI